MKFLFAPLIIFSLTNAMAQTAAPSESVSSGSVIGTTRGAGGASGGGSDLAISESVAPAAPASVIDSPKAIVAPPVRPVLPVISQPGPAVPAQPAVVSKPLVSKPIATPVSRPIPTDLNSLNQEKVSLAGIIKGLDMRIAAVERRLAASQLQPNGPQAQQVRQLQTIEALILQRSILSARQVLVSGKISELKTASNTVPATPSAISEAGGQVIIKESEAPGSAAAPDAASSEAPAPASARKM